MTAVTKDWLASRPRGTVIRVTTPAGNRFELVAEGGTFRDFVLHSGTPAYGLGGRRSRLGGLRVFWAPDRLAAWVAERLCTVELAGGSK